VGGNRSQLLTLEKEELSQLLQRYTPAQRLGPASSRGEGTHWTVSDVKQVVLNKFGVRDKSQTSYRTLLAYCDFSYQQTTKQYKSRNEFKVMDFEEQLEKNSSTRPRKNPPL